MVFEMIFIQPETRLEEQAPAAGCKDYRTIAVNASVVHNQFVAKQITLNYPSCKRCWINWLSACCMLAVPPRCAIFVIGFFAKRTHFAHFQR